MIEPRRPSRVSGTTRVTRATRVFAVAALLAVIGLGFWSVLIEPRLLVTREISLRIPSWPSADDGLRVAILSDLHVGSPYQDISKLRRIVQDTNARKPDITLIPGDLVITGVLFGHHVAPEAIARELRALHAPLGVYAVLGNHDWWLNGPVVAEALRRNGIAVLEDSALHIGDAKHDFWLAGVSDFMTSNHDVAKALRFVPQNAPVIVFTHNPDIFPSVPSRVSLTIAGHTHGGQVSLPFIGPLLVPSTYGTRFAAGHIIEDARHLFVATGIGTSILPIRFRVRPSIVVLTLLSATR